MQFAVFEIAVGKHGGAEGNLSVMDGDTEFEEAIEDIFFHLSGHTGLLYARHGRCMRIGVEGEGTVFGRLLVTAQSFADGEIMIAQARQDRCTDRRQTVLWTDRLNYFADGEEQFGNHVPVDATESFVLVECTASTGEGMMVEDLLIEVFEFIGQLIGIAETGIEMNTSVAVLLENRTEVFLYDRQLFGFLGQVVEFEECFALAVRIEHVASLVFAIEVRRTHSIQQVCRFLRCKQSGR